MRRRDALVVAFGLALGATLSSSPMDTLGGVSGAAHTLPGSDAFGQGYAAVVLADGDLLQYEERAQAAGAIGFYREVARSSLVIVVPTAKRSTFNLAALGPTPLPTKVQYSEIDAAAIDVVASKLLKFPTVAPSTGKSLAFYFRPEIQKLEVITTFDWVVLSDFLGDSRQLIDYQFGGAAALSRDADIPPFWGGAKSHWAQDPTSNSYCTTSFTVKDAGGTRHLVEPAHCGPVGGTVRNWAGTYTVGTYGNKHCGNVGALDNSDVQWITGQAYGSNIYVGGAAGSRADVVEAGIPAVGAPYWYSGARTFEKANQIVIPTDASIWWDDRNDWCAPGDGAGWWQLHLISWQRAGVCDALPGDSGAPFYVRYANTQYPQIGIRGMATAVVGNTCFGEKWPRIQSLLGGVSIATN